MPFRRIFVSLGLLLFGAGAIDYAQQSSLQYEFFSGAVTAVAKTSLRVVRTLPKKPPEEKAFVLNGESRVEGELRRGARVTVGYVVTGKANVVMRVIVRDPAPKQ